MIKRSAPLALAGALLLGLISPAPAAQGTGCLPTTGTVSGLTMTQAINAAIAAVTSAFSGASAPATDCTAAPVKGQVWLDTSVTPNVERRYDGTNWVAVGAIDSVNHLWAPPVGGGTTSITAASTTDICAAASAVQTITGTTAITSFGSSCVVGVRKTLLFNSATPITYNATSMVLPAQRDYTASAGDMADAIYLGSGNWRIKDISKIDGSSVTNPATPVGTIFYGIWGTIPPKTVYGARQALPRASYPDYFAAVTRVQSGTLASGSSTITSLTNTSGVGAGMPIEGVGIPAGAVVSSATSTTIVMSAAATASGSQSVRLFLTGYGQGGDSTTVGVTDCIGQVLAGRDGSSAQLDNAWALNSFQGSRNHTLTTAQLPPITPTFTGTANQAISVTSNVGNIPFAATLGDIPTGNGPTYRLPITNNLAGSLISNGTFTATGSVSGFGSGASHPIVQPTRIAECVVAVLP